MIVETETRPAWDQEFGGLTWRDMHKCNCDETEKKLSFALYRRGLYDPRKDENGRTSIQRSVMGMFAGMQARRRLRNQREEAGET